MTKRKPEGRRCWQCGNPLPESAPKSEHWCESSKDCGNGGFRQWWLERHPEYRPMKRTRRKLANPYLDTYTETETA